LAATGRNDETADKSALVTMGQELNASGGYLLGDPVPMTDLLELSDGDAIVSALRSVDAGSLHFTSLGLTGRLAPTQSAQIFAGWMRHVALLDDVPEDIRRNFDRVRRLFLYGLLERDLFSIAGHQAHFVLEGALRHRFVSYYNGEIPLCRHGVPETLEVATFNDYFKQRSQLKRCQLRTTADGREPLPFNYPALYRWARQRQLLSGQRNVGVFEYLVNRRNDVAHPEAYADELPPWVARGMADVSEIVNKLWGHDTEGGRMFPGPVHRRLRCAAISPDHTAAVTFGSLDGIQTDERPADWTFALFLAAEREDLVDFDWQAIGNQRFKHEPGFQMTDYPIVQIVAPSRRHELLDFIEQHDVNAYNDAVSFQDRVFFIRSGNGDERPEFPRAASDLARYDDADDSACWHVVRADFPMDAWVRIRDLTENETPVAAGTEIVAQLVGDDAARRYAATVD
jgi:hypothetical protein